MFIKKRFLIIIFFGFVIILVIGFVFFFRQSRDKQTRQGMDIVSTNEDKASNMTPSITKEPVSVIKSLEQAVKGKDISICQNFPEADINNCVIDVAYSNNDPGLCKEIKAQDFKNKCLERLLFKKISEGQDQKQCSQLVDTELRQSCNVFFFRQYKDITFCLDLNGQDRKDCQDFIYGREAFEKDNEKTCGLIVFPVKKKECLDNLRSKKRDTDKDGLMDDEETYYGTNPKKADTDGDGYPDGEEVKKGYDPKT